MSYFVTYTGTLIGYRYLTIIDMLSIFDLVATSIVDNAEIPFLILHLRLPCIQHVQHVHWLCITTVHGTHFSIVDSVHDGSVSLIVTV